MLWLYSGIHIQQVSAKVMHLWNGHVVEEMFHNYYKVLLTYI